jgi:hypothetical protein
MKMIFLAALLLSPTAWAKTLVCEYSDTFNQYRDEYRISADETMAAARFLFAGSESKQFERMCWGDRFLITKAEGKMVFQGPLECVDGAQGEFTQTLDLNTMEIDGSWRSDYPCRWENS